MTDAQGRRLFCPLGFWSRPHLIPDAATEATLFQRHASLTQWTMGSMFLGEMLALNYWPAFNSRPEVFFGSLAVLTVLFLVAGWLTHRAMLSRLPRAGHRMSVRQFYSSMAARHTANQLFLRVLLSLGIVAVGYGLSKHPDFAGFAPAPGIAWICMLIMFGCALGWGYSLALKLTIRSTGPMAPGGRGSA